MQKICRLQDEGQLSNAALAPLLKAAMVSLSGPPAVAHRSRRSKVANGPGQISILARPATT